MNHYILAFDLGTSSLKATAFSETGKLIASASRSYQTRRGALQSAEQEPEDWWTATVSACREILARVPAKEIVCVVLSGQMGGCVYLDGSGKPLQPAMIWQDGRGGELLQELTERHQAEIYETLLRLPSGVMQIGRLMWTRENRPEVYHRIHKVLCCKDYLAYKLSGQMVTDETEASATGLYDLRERRWSDRMFELTGLKRSIVPASVPSATAVGCVTREAAAETGLCQGVPLVIGAGDGCAAVIGTGTVGDGEMHCSVGTSGWCGIETSRPILDPGRYRNYSTLSAVPGMYVSFINVEAAGLSYEWLAGILSEAGGGGREYSVLNRLAREAGGSASGLVYLPYITTDIGLHRSTFPQGAFLNIHANQTAGDFLRAAIEGVALYLGTAMRIFSEHGYHPQEVALIGGSVREPLWRRILCDALGVPCRVIAQSSYAVSAGAAVIGGVGCGLFDDFSVSRAFIQTEEVIRPDMQKNRLYKRLAEVGEEAYCALEEINQKIRCILHEAGAE